MRVECVGHISLEVEIGPCKLMANFWVFDMKPTLLIGRDHISKHNIVIDVPKARIMIRNLEIVLKEATLGNLENAEEEDKQKRLELIRQIGSKKLGAPSEIPCWEQEQEALDKAI